MSNELRQFDENAMRKIARSVFREERKSAFDLTANSGRMRGRGGLSRQANEVFPVAFHNNSGEVIPARAIMRVIDTGISKGREFYNVGKPNANASAKYLVNGSQDIAIDGDGHGTWGTDGCLFLYDDSETIVAGEEWGPKSGQWKAYKGMQGFTAFGNPYGDFAMGIQGKPDGVLFFNQSGETIPPYAVMQISEIPLGVVNVIKPTYGMTGLGYLVNGSQEIAVNSYGHGYYAFEKHRIALCRHAGGALPANQGITSYGIVPGKWYISNEYLGTNPGGGSGILAAESIGFYVYSGSAEDDIVVSGETCNPCHVIQYHEQPTQSLDLKIGGIVDADGEDLTYLGDDEPNTGFIKFHDIHFVETLTPPAHRYRLGANWEGLDPATKGMKIFIERDGIYKVELFLKYTITTVIDATAMGATAEKDWGETLGLLDYATGGGVTSADGNHDHGGEVTIWSGTHAHEYETLNHQHIYRDMSKAGIADAEIQVHVFINELSPNETLVKESHRPALEYDTSPLSAKPAAGEVQSFTRHGIYIGELSSGFDFYFTIDFTEASYGGGGAINTRFAVTGGYIHIERLRNGKEMV